jgi:hypothetical protein
MVVCLHSYPVLYLVELFFEKGGIAQLVERRPCNWVVVLSDKIPLDKVVIIVFLT